MAEKPCGWKAPQAPRLPLQTATHHSPTTTPAGRQAGVECFRAPHPSSPPPPTLEETQQRTSTRFLSITEPITALTKGTSSCNPPSALNRYLSLLLSHPGCGLQTDMNDGWRPKPKPVLASLGSYIHLCVGSRKPF